MYLIYRSICILVYDWQTQAWVLGDVCNIKIMLLWVSRDATFKVLTWNLFFLRILKSFSGYVYNRKKGFFSLWVGGIPGFIKFLVCTDWKWIFVSLCWFTYWWYSSVFNDTKLYPSVVLYIWRCRVQMNWK